MAKKLVVILGPTASGKSTMAINLAKKFNGEVISADSRQVYRGMDLGAGKVTKKEMQNVPHHLLDVASPRRRFTVTQYRNLAQKAINKILKKHKTPILCGGTGFYIQAVVDGIVIPEVKPDWRLRKRMERKSVGELYQMLQKLDPRRAGNIDKNNPRRLIRAIEIVIKTKRPVPRLRQGYGGQAYPVLMLGIKKTPGDLKKLIARRLRKRLKMGMTAEVKRLHEEGLSWKRLEEFGLEYRFIAQYLQNKINYDEMVRSIQKESEHFAKRQMTWFSAHGGSASGGKRPARNASPHSDAGGDKRIKWVKNQKEAEKLIERFLLREQLL